MEMKIDKMLRINGWVDQPNSSGNNFKYYSSITSDVIRKWKKEGKETTVITGLNVRGYPPCLIHPLPKKIHEKMYNNPDITAPDPLVIDWVQNSTDQEINHFLDSIK
jgi:hypothetical protein